MSDKAIQIQGKLLSLSRVDDDDPSGSMIAGCRHHFDINLEMSFFYLDSAQLDSGIEDSN